MKFFDPFVARFARPCVRLLFLIWPTAQMLSLSFLTGHGRADLLGLRHDLDVGPLPYGAFDDLRGRALDDRAVRRARLPLPIGLLASRRGNID